MKSHKSIFFRDLGILGIKGLISENAQGISPGTLLDFEEVAPSYKKHQRKQTLSDETRFNPRLLCLYDIYVLIFLF